MNAAATIAISVLLAAGAAVGVTAALTPAAPPPAPPGVGADEFRAAIARLEAEQQKLQLALQQARAEAPVERTAVPVLGEQEIAAAVQRYLAARGLPAEAAAAPAAKTVDVAATFASLQQLRNVNYWSNQEAWKRVFDAGRMDELIAMFEANAKAHPNDPTAQMQLADAYLANVQLDPSKGATHGLRADRVLDRVLELDDNHWQARFTKAVSYTFWPPILGKDKEAMAQFDRLVQQQEGMPIAPEQAQTYLFYGNLLDKAGQSAKAREIWQKGLVRHPDSADLRQRLGQ